MKILTKKQADKLLKEKGKVTDIHVAIGCRPATKAWFFTDDHCFKHELQKQFDTWIPITMYFRGRSTPHIKPRPGIEDGMITNIDKWMIAFVDQDSGVHIQSEKELKDFLQLNQK